MTASEAAALSGCCPESPESQRTDRLICRVNCMNHHTEQSPAPKHQHQDRYSKYLFL